MRRGQSSVNARPFGGGVRRRHWTTAALVLLGLAATSGRAFAQATNTGSITGRVTDAGAGVPLVGAAVRVSGTQIGAATAEDGRYTIRGVRPGRRRSS